MEKIKSRDGKVIAEIHFLTDRKEIKNKEVVNIIKKSLLRCYNEIPIKNKKIVLFYTEDDFIKNKMKGVGADTFFEDVISLQINPLNKAWRKELPNSIAHEYSHLTILDKRKWKTILDSLIIEGIAEVFREEVIGGKPAPWATAIRKKEARDLFNKIKNKLNLPVEKMHQKLFFGSKEFKMWSGYSLGYYIVKKFRDSNKNLKWEEIIKLEPFEILKKSDFL